MQTEITLHMLVALGRLEQRDREIVVNRVVTGESLQTVADRLDVSKERVRQLEQRAIARLREELVRVGYERP